MRWANPLIRVTELANIASNARGLDCVMYGKLSRRE